MKGVKLCIAFSIFFITSLLGSALCSTGANATKHDLGTMPLWGDQYYDENYNFTNLYPSTYGFRIQFKSDSLNASNFDLSKSYAPRWITFPSITTQCIWPGDGAINSRFYHGPNLVTSNGFTFESNVGTIFNRTYSERDASKCYRDVPLGTDGSLPLSEPGVNLGYTAWLKNRPYFYEYDSYVYSNSYKSSTGSVYNSHGLFLSDIIGAQNMKYMFDNVQQVYIPFGTLYNFKDSGVSDVKAGTTIDFHYEIVFSDVQLDISNLSPSDPLPPEIKQLSNSIVYLDWKAVSLRNNQSYDYSGTIRCPVSVESSLTEDNINSYVYYKFNCNFMSEYDIKDNAISFKFRLLPGDNYTDIWHFGNFDDREAVCTSVDFDYRPQCFNQGSDIYMLPGSLYIITDGDPTPGKPLYDLSGGDPDMAIGSASRDYLSKDNDSEVSWSESLVSLFNFNAINPFINIYSMFTDDTCAQIPILADMIHFEETQVCPWFSTDTRNQLTPVFSMASVMLTFGFFVRWLGARSGNMVEDDFSGTTEHFKISKRGKK